MSDSKYFAAVGDVHGRVDAMKEAVLQWSERFRRKIDFVLQVGDFQPHRHADDLKTMAAPSKYKTLGDFHEYYSGPRYFPWPVYFIGGNHEPYGFLGKFPKGSKIMPNCYYLGQVGKLSRAGIQIVGLSGIYHRGEYHRRQPDARKIDLISNRRYSYFREADVSRALTMKPVDVLMLHDWPTGIVPRAITRCSRRYRGRWPNPNIGNEPARQLVDALEPQLVLCGHMHFDLRSTIQHLSGAVTEVYGLGIVRAEDLPLAQIPPNWLEVFRIEVSGRITEVTNSG